MAGVDHDLTDEQWTALKAAWGGCAYCGATEGPVQRDCVLPISRGGRYTLDNVAPACGPCNASKCNDEVTSRRSRRSPPRAASPTSPSRAGPLPDRRHPAEQPASRTTEVGHCADPSRLRSRYGRG